MAVMEILCEVWVACASVAVLLVLCSCHRPEYTQDYEGSGSGKKIPFFPS